MKPITAFSLSLTAFMLLQLVMCSNTAEVKRKTAEALPEIAGDTSLLGFQRAVDTATGFIYEYNKLKYALDKNQDSVESNARAQKDIAEQLAVAETYDLSAICTADTSKKAQSKAREELKKIHNKIFLLQQDHEKFIQEQGRLQQERANATKLLASKEDDLKKLTKKLSAFTDRVTGPVEVRFSGKIYQVFIATNKTHQVYIHNNPKGAYTFKKFSENIQKELKASAPVMLTNGGMFNNNFSPQGLLITNGKATGLLDSTTSKKEGNFYLYPNGVFVADGAEGYRVLETSEYMQAYLYKQKTPPFATQSGPMLVHNGQVHTGFTPGSPNINIRSGAGVTSKEKAIFIISKQEVNFYDMALLYRYVFNCTNALYLDGAISKMYVAGDKDMPGGDFGPMIAVFKTK